MFFPFRAPVLLTILCLTLLTACNGSLVVYLDPPEAVTDGAVWRVDGGSWQQSGARLDLAEGTHTLEFGDTTGWYTPDSQTVQVTAGDTTITTGRYLEGHPDWADDTGTYDVTLAGDVVVIEESNLDLIRASDTTSNTYTFDTAGLAARGLVLTQGAPLLIHGTAVGSMETITTGGGETVVDLTFIPLNDVITDGTIGWDYGVAFTPEKLAAVSFAGKRFLIAKDDNLIDQTFTIGDLTYKLRLALNDVTADLNFTVEKTLSGAVKGSFTAEGKLTRFRSRESMTFSGGAMTNFDHGMDGMRGDVELALVVTASGNDFVNYKLPVPLLEFPFIVGTVPVTLAVGAQFVINASVPFDGSSRVTTGFTYDTDLGFNFNGVQVTPAGGLFGIDLDEGVTETGASSAISANFGLGFPRLSVSVFGNSVVVWAQTAALVGGSFTFTPPCQTANALFLGAAGIDFTFLGYPLASGSHTFFEHEEELLRTAECPDPAKCLDLDDTAWVLVYEE
jgi:hypothetical protein